MRKLLVLCCAFPLWAQVDSTMVEKLAARFHPQDRAFAFAAIGDQQYGPVGERKWPALVASIHQLADQIQFVVHVGDIKSGATRCTDELFANRLASFNEFQVPFILTPGDNEWTDCHRASNGSYDPLERLAKLRTMFFTGEESMGKKRRPLVRQSAAYPENAIWAEGNFVFATLHIVGSDNNHGRNAMQDREYDARNQATLDWMRTAFTLAKRNNFGGVVLVFQADPFFPLTSTKPIPTTPGFVDTLRVMEEETVAFTKPVLAVQGDSHFFRFDKPLAHSGTQVPVENFFRLEVPGEEDVHWVRVDIDPTAPDSPFRVQHRTVRENAR